MSAVPINSLVFSDTEKKYYVTEFERCTKTDKRPVNERVRCRQQLMGTVAAQIFRKTKLPDQALKEIWDLSSEGQPFLMLQNFLAAMRMCSILKQRKELTWTNIQQRTSHSAQKALGKSDKPQRPQETSPPIQPETGFENVKLEEEEKKQTAAMSESTYSMHQSSEIAPEPQKKSSEIDQLAKTIEAVKPPEEIDTEKNREKEGIAEEKIVKVEESKSRSKSDDFEPKISVKTETISERKKSDSAVSMLPKKTVDISKDPEKPEVGDKSAKSVARKSSMEECIPELVVQSDGKQHGVFIVEAPDEVGSKESAQMFQKPPGRSLTMEEVKKPPTVFSPSESMSEVEDIEILPPKPLKTAKVTNPPLPRIEEESPRNSLITPTEQPRSVEVINPRTVSAGWFGGSYTLYTVQTHLRQKNTQVERRFRDLDWMHTQLCTQFKGVSIPPLPAKPMFGTQSAKFIEERRAQMEKYLNMIVQHRTLYSSQVVSTFLYSPLDQFEKDKARAEEEAAQAPYTGVEDVVDHLMAKIHSKINSTLISKSAPPSREIVQLESRLSLLAAPTTALSAKFSDWVQGNRDTLRTIEDLEIPGNEDFTQTTMRLIRIENTALREMERLAMDFKEESMRIEAIQNAITAYQVTSEQYAQQEALILRKESKKRACPDEESSSRYGSEITSAIELRSKLGTELVSIQSNLEADGSQFTLKREEHMWITMKEVVDRQVNRWQQSADFWRSASFK